MPKRQMPDDEVSLLVAVVAVIVLAIFLLLVTAGCSVMPERIVVRDEAGNKLAEADPATGNITMTWYGLEALRPKIYMPQRKK